MNSAKPTFSIRVSALALASCLVLAGCATTGGGAKRAAKPSLEEQWGIQIASLRMSAAGHVVDFRYRIVDPEKAARVADRKLKPQLIDQASSLALSVPAAPKVGALRQTSVRPIAGRTYFVLFGNPNQIVKAGSKVTVVIGEFRAENLVVE